jgi:hypothetical protein
MKPLVKLLLVGASLAAGGAMFTVACGDGSPLPVSPSTAPVAGVDGSNAKGVKNFCARIQAHEWDPIYVVGQEVDLSVNPDGSDPLWQLSGSPHGDVCFPIPGGTDVVYITITPGENSNYADDPDLSFLSGYCGLSNVPFAVHGGPSYIWLLPNDGTHVEACRYDAGPY